VSPLGPFRNEPVLELRRAAARRQLAAGMDELEPQLPLRVPLWIGGDHPSSLPGRPSAMPDHFHRSNRSTCLTIFPSRKVNVASMRFWTMRPVAENT